MIKSKWYEKSYRRNLVDMHIEDWDDRFMSEFDPESYINMLKIAQIQSAMLYANSHIGYCYWPTETGVMHKGIKGRDILGELVDGCKKEGIDAILYYSLVYNNWAYENNPLWRIIDADGKAARDKAGVEIFGGRYGVCCPNSGYKDFIIKQIEELCINYEFKGIFFDMTFWPFVCYCPSCKERYKKEVGGEIPKLIDWSDQKWVSFQRKREEWITEFAHIATGVIKKYNPDTSVEHQFSGACHPWTLGTTDSLVKASDYAGGDFYGGFTQQSFISKYYYSVTPNKPMEFMTSRCYPDLQAHTSMKPDEMLKIHNYLTLAHGGAFLIIDAIDPVGTLNQKVYEKIGEIFTESKEYEPFLGGDLCQDVAIYFNLEAKVNFSDNGKPSTTMTHSRPHMEAAVEASRTLKENHIPFGVVGSSNLEDLSEFQILIMPDVLMLAKEQADLIKKYVENGGSLYVSGNTPSTFLKEVIGVDIQGTTEETITYISPKDSGKRFLTGMSEKYPLAIRGCQTIAKASCEHEVIGKVVLPYTNPSDEIRFATIHANPPGKVTDYPAIVNHKYGKGSVLWISAPLEVENQEPHKSIFVTMVRELATKPFRFEVDAPGIVEITLFHQPEYKRFILNIVNVQEQFPVIPISGIKVKVHLNNMKALKAVLLPLNEEIPIVMKEEYAEISVPTLVIFQMISVEYTQ